MSEDLERLVATAEAAIRDAAPKADADPSRPLYHFRAPAQWMDDPNGIIFHNGMYHMMYSLNPHNAAHRAGMVYKTAVRVWDPNSEDWTGGVTVWGHARSRDLVHWEHLPIALYPSIDKGEHFIWFGCTVINDEGVPMAIYTAVGPHLRPEDTAQQWAALGDPDLLNWTPLPTNPILADDVHGSDVIGEWRDPFVFKEAGRSFMVLGGRLRDAAAGQPVVCLYEAADAGFTHWTYRGIIYRDPRRNVPSAECPNLVKIDGRWILLVSPHAEVEYHVGTLDLDTYSFRIESSGIVDHSKNFYATNILFDGEGRAVMWGAVVGFKGTANWNGCVSLPRQLNVTAEGRLRQKPVTELESLRGARISFSEALPSGGTVALGTVEEGQALEIRATISCNPATSWEVRLRSSKEVLGLRVDGESVVIGTLRFPIDRQTNMTLVHLLIDRTVAEVFVGETAVATCIIPLIAGPVDIDLHASGPVKAAAIEVWQLQASGLFTYLDEADGRPVAQNRGR